MSLDDIKIRRYPIGFPPKNCSCEIEQYREYRIEESFACHNLARWEIDGKFMCGTHAQSLIWRRFLERKGIPWKP
jgi:hypothetical protein